jgi:hypothetical protein
MSNDDCRFIFARWRSFLFLDPCGVSAGQFVDQNSIALTRNQPSRLHREHEQAERDDGQRNHGSSDNRNPSGLGHGTLPRVKERPWRL